MKIGTPPYLEQVEESSVKTRIFFSTSDPLEYALKLQAVQVEQERGSPPE
jgi:hypothetical protein